MTSLSPWCLNGLHEVRIAREGLQGGRLIGLEAAAEGILWGLESGAWLPGRRRPGAPAHGRWCGGGPPADGPRPGGPGPAESPGGRAGVTAAADGGHVPGAGAAGAPPHLHASAGQDGAWVTLRAGSCTVAPADRTPVHPAQLEFI